MKKIKKIFIVLCLLIGVIIYSNSNKSLYASHYFSNDLFSKIKEKIKEQKLVDEENKFILNEEKELYGGGTMLVRYAEIPYFHGSGLGSDNYLLKIKISSYDGSVYNNSSPISKYSAEVLENYVKDAPKNINLSFLGGVTTRKEDILNNVNPGTPSLLESLSEEELSKKIIVADQNYVTLLKKKEYIVVVNKSLENDNDFYVVASGYGVFEQISKTQMKNVTTQEIIDIPTK